MSFAHFQDLYFATKFGLRRGLDNAGKTTIVKKIMNEDVNSVSPTLGFIIKTIDYDGYAPFPQPMGFDFSRVQDTNLTSVLDSIIQFKPPLTLNFPTRGCRRTEDAQDLLEKLF